MNISGLALDWIEKLAKHHEPTMEPAGHGKPRIQISDFVSVSHESPFFIYHVPYGEMGLGASLGNASTWVETKGTGDMLSLFSIELGKRVFGGMAVTYQLPFSDLSFAGQEIPGQQDGEHRRLAADRLARATPSSEGEMNFHPGFQQRTMIIGDGLDVLETFFVPRTTDDGPCAACVVVSLRNSTGRPIKISVVGSVAMRGETERDLQAKFDRRHHCLIAWNESQTDWVRVFGCTGKSPKYLASTNEEMAYSPRSPLPDEVEGMGDLLGALEEDLLLLPNDHKHVSFVVAFSKDGEENALRAFKECLNGQKALQETIDSYEKVVSRAILNCPDRAISEGMAWAKACLIRPLAAYKVGITSTNDPGQSSNIVGRDTSWMSLGADYVIPEATCGMLRVLAGGQREDGLIPEYIDGLTGHAEYLGFNINDATPLFITAISHHVKMTGHKQCLDEFLPAALRAGEHILSQIDERGLVLCTASGVGPRAICGWRNVLQNEQISGAVTEVNAECYAALRSLDELCRVAGRPDDAARFNEAANSLKGAINSLLIDPESGLYVRNIDVNGNAFTQATVDMIYPLVCGVAEESTRRIVCARLGETDFLTPVGLRVLSQESPNYDPSKESGCLGGIWTGATWWYAMAVAETNTDAVAPLLSSSYRHYLEDPKTSNTVPGQFSEWSDGETFVNRGMRLSPWDPPRFITACVECLAGVRVGEQGIEIKPAIPKEWKWLHVHDLPIRGKPVSFFMFRQNSELLLATADDVAFPVGQSLCYDERLESPETITIGVGTAAFRSESEALIALGNSLPDSISGPFLTHHILKSGRRYRVYSLVSPEHDWRDAGVLDGGDIQRINVRLEPQGYALFRFSEHS